MAGEDGVAGEGGVVVVDDLTPWVYWGRGPWQVTLLRLRAPTRTHARGHQAESFRVSAAHE